MRIIMNIMLFVAVTLIALTYTFSRLSQFNTQISQSLMVR